MDNKYLKRLPIIILPEEKEDFLEIAEDMEIILSTGELIVIPKGMRFDGRSTPWYLRWLFPKLNKKVLPYIIHDYLYKYDFKRADWGDKRAKEFADNEMKYFQELIKQSKIESDLCYNGVKVFGWKVFYKWREQ